MNVIKDYIVVIENAITDGLCDVIFAEYAAADDWVSATTADGKTDAERQCSTVGISFDSIIQKNPTVRGNIDKYLFTTASGAISKYNAQFPLCAIQQDSGYDLLRYEAGQHYKQHTDSFKNRLRAVSCSFMLNDDYEGGEFAFFDRELVYKLKKGSCIMFPSNFMYPHEIMPVTSGTRYSIITWFI
jgi:predicted 2-oxoglutarate/Fe(II)-dependent dioxygenase YbiX